MPRSLSKSLPISQTKSLASEETYDWRGASGQSYKYYVIPISNTFKDTPGNYIYAKLTDNTWEALYIGQSSSLSRRPEGAYERQRAAVRLGASHVHAHISNPDENIRKAEQLDLIQSLHPPLNEEAVVA
jgi:hypothetical protein